MANRTSNIAAATASAMFLYVAPALAEVCDKVEPPWDSDYGPATIPDEVHWALASPSGIIVLATMILAVLFRSRMIAAMLGMGIAALGLLIWLGDEDSEVRSWAIAEGCRTGFPTSELLFVVTGLAILLYGHYRRV